MSYQFYKFVHFLSLFTAIVLFGVNYLKQEPSKLYKIISKVALVFLFVSGMGLIARIGLPHGSAWPGWIYFKIVNWAIIGIAIPIIIKKMKLGLKVSLSLFLAILAITIYLAVFKPSI